MSSTVYWQQVTPDEPLGSWSQLKWLLFDEGNRPPSGEKVVIGRDHGNTHTYLRGFLDALPADDARQT